VGVDGFWRHNGGTDWTGLQVISSFTFTTIFVFTAIFTTIFAFTPGEADV